MVERARVALTLGGALGGFGVVIVGVVGVVVVVVVALGDGDAFKSKLCGVSNVGGGRRACTESGTSVDGVDGVDVEPTVARNGVAGSEMLADGATTGGNNRSLSTQTRCADALSITLTGLPSGNMSTM